MFDLTDLFDADGIGRVYAAYKSAWGERIRGAAAGSAVLDDALGRHGFIAEDDGELIAALHRQWSRGSRPARATFAVLHRVHLA